MSPGLRKSFRYGRSEYAASAGDEGNGTGKIKKFLDFHIAFCRQTSQFSKQTDLRGQGRQSIGQAREERDTNWRRTLRPRAKRRRAG